METSERQYTTYGDYAKKQMRKMGEVMQSEARTEKREAQWSSVIVGSRKGGLLEHKDGGIGFFGSNSRT